MSLYHRIDGWQAEVAGEKQKIVLPAPPPKKYVCGFCDAIYGEGLQTNPEKMERGTCSRCWDGFLWSQRQHARELRKAGKI